MYIITPADHFNLQQESSYTILDPAFLCVPRGFHMPEEQKILLKLASRS